MKKIIFSLCFFILHLGAQEFKFIDANISKEDEGIYALVEKYVDLNNQIKEFKGGGYCKIIEPNSSIKGLFDENMDIIFANQSLYYIPLKELKQNILEFYELLNTGGILFATMMSKKNYYFSHSQKEEKNGLSKVEINGRLNETSFIHFIDKAEDLENLFQPFETLFLGDYDPINFYNFEGSAHHYIYIGIKK